MTAAELSQDASGELVEHRDELTARAESYARGARAANTWSAYERQWRRFETWCAAAGERSLPADPLTVARFGVPVRNVLPGAEWAHVDHPLA